MYDLNMQGLQAEGWYFYGRKIPKFESGCGLYYYLNSAEIL